MLFAFKNKKLLYSCMKEVREQQQVHEGSVIDDEVDQRVSDICKKENCRICPNCSTVMPKSKRKCINMDCRVDLKAAEKQLSGEDILGTALFAPLRQHNYRYKEDQLVMEVQNVNGKEVIVEKIVSTVQEGFKIEWNHVPSNHPQSGVSITVSDPCFVNPSSQATVAEVLRHVGGIACLTRYGHVGEGSREWLPVTMDGLPYFIALGVIDDTFLCIDCPTHNAGPYYGKEWLNHIRDIHGGEQPNSCKEFDWVVLLIGPLHIEMNMVKYFFSLNWEVFLKDLSKEMGFESEGALKYIKGASDHHKAMTLVNVLLRGGWCELLVPYVRQQIVDGDSLSVEDYLHNWLPTVKNPSYDYMFRQLWRYAGSNI